MAALDAAYEQVTCPACGRGWQRIDFRGARHRVTCDVDGVEPIPVSAWGARAMARSLSATMRAHVRHGIRGARAGTLYALERRGLVGEPGDRGLQLSDLGRAVRAVLGRKEQEADDHPHRVAVGLPSGEVLDLQEGTTTPKRSPCTCPHRGAGGVPLAVGDRVSQGLYPRGRMRGRIETSLTAFCASCNGAAWAVRDEDGSQLYSLSGKARKLKARRA